MVFVIFFIVVVRRKVVLLFCRQSSELVPRIGNTVTKWRSDMLNISSPKSYLGARSGKAAYGASELVVKRADSPCTASSGPVDVSAVGGGS